jgi:hypothetical protein
MPPALHTEAGSCCVGASWGFLSRQRMILPVHLLNSLSLSGTSTLSLVLSGSVMMHLAAGAGTRWRPHCRFLVVHDRPRGPANRLQGVEGRHSNLAKGSRTI